MLTWGKYEYSSTCVLCPQPDRLEGPSLNAALIQASIMEYHRLSGLWTTLLEAGSLRSGCQQGQAPVRTLCWTANCQLFTSSPGGEQTEKAISHDINLIHEESALMSSSNPNYLPKVPPPNTVVLWGGERVPTYALGVGSTRFRLKQMPKTKPGLCTHGSSMIKLILSEKWGDCTDPLWTPWR